MPCCNFCTFKSLIYRSHSQEGGGDSIVFRYWPSSETQGLLVETMRYFGRATFLAWKFTSRAEEPLGIFSYQMSSRSSRNQSRWLARKIFFWPISVFSTTSTTSGTRLVRKSDQGLFSPWSKLSRQKCRSPENIASSRLVARGSLGIILHWLITTSVTSHSNEWTLWMDYSDYAIEEGQQRLRKMKKIGLISLSFAN